MLQKAVSSLPVILLLFCLSCTTGTATPENIEAKDAIRRSVKLYSSGNWEIRRMAISRVVAYSGTAYSRNVILLLLKATDDPYPLVRVEALNALTRIKTESAHVRIREMALYDSESVVRWSAYKALEVYGSAEDETVFITGYGDSDWLIREAAIRGLLKIEDEAVQSRNVGLVVSAIHDNSVAVQIDTLNNIRYKSPDLYNEITALVNNKKTGISLLKAALTALSGYRLDETTRNRLVKLLTHENREIRVLALRALKKDDELKKN